VPVVDEESCKLANDLPVCPWCGAVARPNILMFGDADWSDWRSRDQDRRLGRWIEGAERIVVVELGAGTANRSVRHFSNRVIIERGATLVRINPREPMVPRLRDVFLAGTAMARLRALDCLLGSDAEKR
jgi:hypothetical protein